ncbi:unnamed protein product [Amaranthus hypochondriacus]
MAFKLRNCMFIIAILIIFSVVLSFSTISCEGARLPAATTRPPICPACVCCSPALTASCCVGPLSPLTSTATP